MSLAFLPLLSATLVGTFQPFMSLLLDSRGMPEQLQPLLQYLSSQDAAFANATATWVRQKRDTTWKLKTTENEEYYVRCSSREKDELVPLRDMLEMMRCMEGMSTLPAPI